MPSYPTHPPIRRLRTAAGLLGVLGVLTFGCVSRDDGGGSTGPGADAGPGGGGSGGSGPIPTGGEANGGNGQGGNGQGGNGQGGNGQGGNGQACDGEAPPATCEGLSPRPCTPRAGSNGATLVRGTVVSPDEVICDGEVLFDRASRKILCVGEDCSASPQAAAATVVCGDLVLPGIINPHDHMSYNTLPRWQHEGPTFTARGQWSGAVGDEMYDALMEPDDSIASRYAELRLLMAGTTAVHKSQAPQACFDGPRNLDRGEDGNDLGYANDDFTECVFPLRDNCSDAPDYNSGRNVPARRYVAHVSEGTDQATFEEFDTFAEQGQLGEKTTIIHCVSCDGAQLTQVRGAGAGLVWSPQSNIDLYGVTMDVPTAVRMGIPVAIGPDWTPSGTMNQLAEMKCAAHVSDRYFAGALNARDILRMVTRDAAVTMGVDDLVGTLEVGKTADVLVLSGDRSRPYDSVVAATNAEVSAVFIGGVAHYGDPEHLNDDNAFNDLCEPVEVCGRTKRICVKSAAGQANSADADDWARFGLQDHIDYLERNISSRPGANGEFAYAYNLYPLFECQPVFDCDLGNRSISGTISGQDADGDDAENGADNCPDVFNPNQGDLDEDGKGDACDPCPWSAVDCPCRVPIAGDRDGDDVGDAEDNCPDNANADQANRDGDDLGDACDFCPDDPSADGCPTPIYAVKRGEVPVATAVRIEGVVTAVVPNNNNFFVQVPGDHPDYAGVEYSGLFVFLGNAPDGLTPPVVGDRIRVAGKVNDFFGQKQLANVSRLEITAREAQPPAPETVDAAAVATGGARAAALEGVRVCVDDVSVTALAPPPGAGDREPTNEFVVTGELRINDLFYLRVPPPTVGEHFDRICGVLRFANENSKLEPTGPADLNQGPVMVTGLTPPGSLLRAGTTAVPVDPTGLSLRVELSGAAGEGGEAIAVTSADPSIATVEGAVVVAAGQSSAAIRLRGVAPGQVDLTAEIAGRGRATTTVRVVAADARPGRLVLDPEDLRIPTGGSGNLRLLVDVPAPAGGYEVTLQAAPALVGIPPSVTIPEGQLTGEVLVDAGDAPGETSITARLEALSATTTVEVTAAAAGNGLVINEVNYDMGGTEDQEFVEIVNAGNAPVALSGWRLELVNGRDGAVYAAYDLDGGGAAELAPGAYLLVADQSVVAPAGVPVVRLPSASNNNHNIENGDPDGMRLINGANPDAPVDGVSYGGPLAGTGEGASSAPDDPNDDAGTTIGRCPNGSDTNDNAADFVIGEATPGAANTCP